MSKLRIADVDGSVIKKAIRFVLEEIEKEMRLVNHNFRSSKKILVIDRKKWELFKNEVEE